MKRLICLLIVVYGLTAAVVMRGARVFNGTSSDHLQNTTTPISKYARTGAFSMVIFGKFSTSNFKYYVAYDDIGPGDHAGWYLYNDSSGRPVFAVSSGTGTSRAAGGNLSVPATYIMLGGAYDGSGTVTRWQGGVKDDSTTTTAFTPTYQNNRGISFGIYPDLTFCGCANMTAAYFAFWDVLLTDAEFRSMAGQTGALGDIPGNSPLTVRPTHLTSFIPMAGYSPEYDLVSTPFNLTVTGTSVVTTNPPITIPYPGPRSKPQGVF